MNGEITRIPLLMAAYSKVREETKCWGDYKKLPEETSEFPLKENARRSLRSANPQDGAFETNEWRMAKFSEMKDPCFIGRNVAVLQCKQFVYTDETTRRRMNNAATPKPDDLKRNERNLTWLP